MSTPLDCIITPFWDIKIHPIFDKIACILHDIIHWQKSEALQPPTPPGSGVPLYMVFHKTPSLGLVVNCVVNRECKNVL